jgi:hypothetical protein
MDYSVSVREWINPMHLVNMFNNLELEKDKGSIINFGSKGFIPSGIFYLFIAYVEHSSEITQSSTMFHTLPYTLDLGN